MTKNVTASVSLEFLSEVVDKHYDEIESNIRECIRDFRESLADPDNPSQWERAYEQGMARVLLRVQAIREEMSNS